MMTIPAVYWVVVGLASAALTGLLLVLVCLNARMPVPDSQKNPFRSGKKKQPLFWSQECNPDRIADELLDRLYNCPPDKWVGPELREGITPIALSESTGTMVMWMRVRITREAVGIFVEYTNSGAGYLLYNAAFPLAKILKRRLRGVVSVSSRPSPRPPHAHELWLRA